MTRCDVYIVRYGSLKTSSEKRSELFTSPNILDFVHSDLVGLMESKSIGGARYILTFIDDYSRKIFVYFIKEKSEVLNKFIEFKAMVE